MTDHPEKNAEDAKKPVDDADGANPEVAAPAPILIDDELEDLVHYTAPPIPPPRIKELLLSPDPPSRFITLLSFAFAFMAIGCAALLVSKYLQMRAEQKTVAVEETQPKLEKVITQLLGEFKLILKGAESPNDGELRVDIVAECSTEEACLYLKDHHIQARDIVIPVLINVRREEILDPETKLSLRRRIAEQLNTLPMKGKVIQILFSDLTIEEAPDS